MKKNIFLCKVVMIVLIEFNRSVIKIRFVSCELKEIYEVGF